MPKIKQFVSTLMKDVPNPNLEKYATIHELTKKYTLPIMPLTKYSKTLYNKDLLQLWEITIQENNLLVCEQGKIHDLTQVHKRKDAEKLNTYSQEFIVNLKEKVVEMKIKLSIKQLLTEQLTEIETYLKGNNEQYIVLEKYPTSVNEYEMYLCKGISTKNYIISTICSYNPSYTTRKYLNTEVLYNMYMFICQQCDAENYTLTNAELDSSYIDFKSEKITHTTKNAHIKTMSSFPTKTMVEMLNNYCNEYGIISKDMPPQEVALFSELMMLVKLNIIAHVEFD